MRTEVLEWSSCDPQQYWVELWRMWMEGGVRTELGYQHCYLKVADWGEEEQGFQVTRTKWPKQKASLLWSLTFATS